MWQPTKATTPAIPAGFFYSLKGRKNFFQNFSKEMACHIWNIWNTLTHKALSLSHAATKCHKLPRSEHLSHFGTK